MDGQKITGKDIAKMAGVSPAAVSLVKTGKGGVSDKTRKRIIQIMKQTGYYNVDDDAALPKNIVLLFREDLHAIKQYFYSEINASIVSACRGLPYNLILTAVDYSDAHADFPQVLQMDSADAVIVYGDPDQAILRRLLQLKIPFVILDSSRKTEDLCTVCVDYETAAYEMVQYLIGLGHKDIAYIGNNNLHTAYDFNLLAFSGFQKAIAEHDFSLDINFIQFDAYDEQSLYSCIDNVFAGSRSPTALFCTTDHNAILALNYLWKKGLRVPEDISVAGIDDLSISKYTVPALTTVHIDREKIGQLSIELIGRMLRGEQCKKVYVNHSKLVIRESTAPPPKSK